MKSDKPDRVLMMVDPKDGSVLLTLGVERSDGGESVIAAMNTVYMYDSKGSYIPCTAGGYHVHRGPLAADEAARCNCIHERLVWLAKQVNVLMCSKCRRTFMLEESPDDDREVVCATEKDGVVSTFTPKDGVDWKRTTLN